MPATPPAGYQFKPGQSGNPSGGKKLPEHLAKVRLFSRTEINALFALYLRMTKEELQERAEDPKTPAIELWLVSSIIGGIKKNDVHNLVMMLERMFGRAATIDQEERSTLPQVMIMLPSNGKEAKVVDVQSAEKNQHVE